MLVGIVNVVEAQVKQWPFDVGVAVERVVEHFHHKGVGNCEPKRIQLNKYHGAPTAIVVNAARPSCPRIAADPSAIHTTRMTRSARTTTASPPMTPNQTGRPSTAICTRSNIAAAIK